MKRIIEELSACMDHEINQIGLTPRTNCNWTQEEHDLYHRQRADEYESAIQILSATFHGMDRIIFEPCLSCENRENGESSDCVEILIEAAERKAFQAGWEWANELCEIGGIHDYVPEGFDKWKEESK